MIDHYNAFISYKHAPLDNKVASDLQRNLEHLVIPASIRKKTGIKKIERIFRDKDELPITSDLSDTISNALEKSDYLIVICSTNTAKSSWVPKEIEYFLRNHTKKQVFTVLADGESQNVIPKELRFDERTVVDEKGNEKNVTVQVEPLACDFRLPRRRALKEELPRLASAIIGCSYDELIRRQRQFRMRRLGVLVAGVLALTFAFAGYMLYSKIQIDKNYKESLANQSRYLANQSIQMYDNNMRVDAINMALASLPADENDDRPVTSESIKALIYSTGAYSNPDDTFMVDWDFPMEHVIKDFTLSSEGTYIASYDNCNNVMSWNTETHEKVLDISLDQINDFVFLSDGSLLLINMNTVYNYSIPQGKLRWTYKLNSGVFEINYYKKDNFNYICEIGDGTLLIPYDSFNFCRLRISDGKDLTPIKLPDKCGMVELSGYLDYSLSPDCNKIAALGRPKDYNSNRFICVYDLVSNSFVYSELSKQNENGFSIGWGDNEHLLRDYHETFDLYDRSSESDRYGNYSITVNETHHVQCFSAADMSVLWDKEFHTRGVKIGIGFLSIPETNNVLFYIGDSAFVLDITNGNKIYGDRIPGSIVSARVNKGSVVLISDAGDFTILSPDISENAITSCRCLPNDMIKALQNHGLYVLREDMNRVLRYYDCDGDFDWSCIDNINTYSDIFPNYRICKNGYIAILQKDLATNVYMHIYNLKDMIYIGSFFLSDTVSINDYTLLDIQDGIVYCSNSDSGNRYLVSVDTNTKKIQSKIIGGFALIDEVSMVNGQIVFFESIFNKNFISIYTLIDESKISVPVDFEIGNFSFFQYFPNSKCVFYSDSLNSFLLNIDTCDIKELDLYSNLEYSPLACENQVGSKIAIADLNKVIIFDLEKEYTFKIDCNGKKPLGLTVKTFNKDKYDTLLVVYHSGEIIRYNCTTTEVIGSSLCGGTVSAGFQERLGFILDKDKSMLYLQYNNALTIIDTNSWLQYANIKNCYGYSFESNVFIVMRGKSSLSDQYIGYIKNYSLDELKSRAEKLLNGNIWSPEKRMAYGLKTSSS